MRHYLCLCCEMPHPLGFSGECEGDGRRGTMPPPDPVAVKRKPQPLTAGMKIYHWTLKQHVPAKKHPRWLCRCSCGVVRAVLAYALRAGRTKCCGHTRVTRKWNKRTV